MDNKKIPTVAGTIIIVIIAITFGVFVWVYERGQEDVAVVTTPILVHKNLPLQTTSPVPSLSNEPEGTCEYTEKEIAVPKELAANKVVFTHDIRQAIGKNVEGYGCLSILGNITKELVPPDDINKETVDSMFAHGGLVLKDILANQNEFQVTKILEVTKHGIGTIDSGSGPIYFLVLTDKTGDLFQIATVMLEENGADGRGDIAILRTPSKDYLLTPDNFDKYDSKTGKSDFMFRLEPEENLESFL